MIAKDQEVLFLPNFCSTKPFFLLIFSAELLAILVVLLTTPLEQLNWLSFALTSFYIQWIFLLSGISICFIRRFGKQLSPVYAALLGYFGILFSAFMATLIAQWVLMQMSPGEQSDHLLALEVLRPMLVTALLGGMAMRYWYLQWDLNRRRRSEWEHRLDALQARIRPHFLFNSINIIASLIQVDPVRAEAVIEDLADLFRVSLNTTQKLVSLRSERSLCEKYIAIEKLRMGDRLQVSWELEDDGLLEASIPPLTLQPIIENAINHGIHSLANGGLVTITFARKAGALEITVTNPVGEEVIQDADRALNSKRDNRMALSNISERLNAVFPGKAKFEWGLQGDHYQTLIRLPIEHRMGC